MRLVPAQSDREPTAGVERSRRLDHAAHYSRQRAADLRRTHTVRQLVPERHLGEELERAEPIGEGAADGREGALGRDQALLNGGVAARPHQDRRTLRLPIGVVDPTRRLTSSRIGWMTK